MICRGLLYLKKITQQNSFKGAGGTREVVKALCGLTSRPIYDLCFFWSQCYHKIHEGGYREIQVYQSNSWRCSSSEWNSLPGLLDKKPWLWCTMCRMLPLYRGYWQPQRPEVAKEKTSKAIGCGGVYHRWSGEAATVQENIGKKSLYQL